MQILLGKVYSLQLLFPFFSKKTAVLKRQGKQCRLFQINIQLCLEVISFLPEIQNIQKVIQHFPIQTF